VDVPALTEGPGSGEVQNKGFAPDSAELGVQVVGPVLAKVAGELQGDVQSLPGPPVGLGKAALEGLEGLGGLVWKVQGG
jgi:hypothetical protein